MAKGPTDDLVRGIRVAIKRLPHGIDLDLPIPATSESAGVDLMAALNKPILLAPNARTLIPTGICIQLPIGFEAQIRPRSGLALKNGITILNSPGTIDADYRGEVKVILANLGTEDFSVERSMRIAQLVISPVVQPIWDEVSELDDTERGNHGFGSTGMRK
jgi:dUTP pyrophosphatase